MEELTPQRFIANSGWRFASTMPEAPHEYTVRDLADPSRTTAMGSAEFEWFARLTLEMGTPGEWDGVTYHYFELDGWKYWTMGSPPEETTIINRARLT